MEALALVDRDGSWTYGELAGRVAVLRSALAGRGVGPGDSVLVVCANDRESVAVHHAIVTLGAVSVLSQYSAGQKERSVALELARPVLAVVSPRAAQVADELASQVSTVVTSDLTNALDPGGDLMDPVDRDPDAPCVVVFTSGTTSRPKGVVHSQSSLAAAVECFRAATDLGATDRLFLVSPLASITGVTQALGLAPVVGGAVVLESEFTPGSSFELLAATGGTFFGGPDVVLERLLDQARRSDVDLPIRLAALGGTMLRRELIKAAEAQGVRVIRMYGSSEVPCSVSTRPDEPDGLRLVDEGLPGPGVEVRLAAGGTGELEIAGPHRFIGYLSEAGIDPADEWFATGDEAVIDSGRVKIVGRLKDIAIRNGLKISLAEVDDAFAAAAGINECAAFVVPDPATGERVALAVHLKPGAALDVPEVLAVMRASGLARYKLPEELVRLDHDLPVTATGKVQRRLLPGDGAILWQADRVKDCSGVKGDRR